MREQQAAQMAAAFIIRAGRPLGKIRLVKLMYLAERESMAGPGFPSSATTSMRCGGACGSRGRSI